MPTLAPTKPLAVWRDHPTWFGGMRHPAVSAHVANFGCVELVVVHDLSGWWCRCGVFRRPLLETTAEAAMEEAVALLWMELERALDAMEVGR